jgi:hypothetical protein
MAEFGFTSSQTINNGLTYMGAWNALTNNPVLTSSIGVAGQYYIVSVAGTTNLNGVTDWQVGDWAIFEGTSNQWQKIDNHDILAYSVIQNEGTPLAQQNTIDFQGDGVTASNGSGKTIITIPNYSLQSVVNVSNGISNFGGIGNASIQSTNFSNDRTVYINNDSNPAIKIEDNLNGTHYTTFDIDTLNLSGNSYNWSSVVQSYKTIQEEGVSLPQQNTIDFQGAGVTASNGSGKTIVTIAGSPSTNSYGLYAQTANGAPVTATTVETTIIGAGVGTLTVPANGFSIGDSFQASLDGLLSCVGTATLHIHVKTLTGVILADTGIIAMDTTTAKSWSLTLYFTIRNIGTTTVASISSGGLFSYIKNAGTNFEGYVLSNINNTTFDTTISNTLIVTAQWNTTNAGNSIVTRNFTLTKIY